MSPVCVHFNTSKRWSSSLVTFSTLRTLKPSLTSIIQTFCILVKAQCLKRCCTKVWTHSQQRIISQVTRVKGQGKVCVCVWASVSSMRKLFAPLDQFGQTNLNHSHSNEPIRKTHCDLWPHSTFTFWGAAPFKIVHNRLFLAHTCKQPLLPHCSFYREFWHHSKPVSMAVGPIQFAPGAVNRAQLGCCVHIHLGVENKAKQYKNYSQICTFCQPFCVFITFLWTDRPLTRQLYRYFKT